MRLSQKICILLLCALPLTVSVNAQDNADIAKLFTVYKISVDERARSAAEARTRAIRKAERLAYNALVSRLIPAEKIPFVPYIEDAELSRLVSGFEVSNEATSRGRYIADMDIVFMPEPMMDIWTEGGMTFALNAGPLLCVVHGHFTADKAYLWEEENPSKQAWENAGWVNALRDYAPIEGTIAVRSALDVSLLKRDLVAAGKIVSRNCASDNSLVIKTEETDEGLKYQYWVSDVAMMEEGVDIADDGESLADQFIGLVDDIVYNIDESWRLLSTVEGFKVEELLLFVEVQRIGDLARARQELAKLSVISGIVTNKISVPMSEITVSYTGSIEQLDLAVRQAGYHIEAWGENFMLSPIKN